MVSSFNPVSLVLNVSVRFPSAPFLRLLLVVEVEALPVDKYEARKPPVNDSLNLHLQIASDAPRLNPPTRTLKLDVAVAPL